MELILFDLVLVTSYLWFPATMSSETLLSPKGVNYEVAALISVKKDLVDSLLFMKGWDVNSVDPCTWNMVGCSTEGFVVSLEMASKGLEGKISHNIGNLSHLKTMLLQNNGLSGSIPSEIGKLSVLQTLDLSANQFSGRLPSSLGLLTQLTYLRLSNNNFDGQIPRTVANLRGLSFLDISYNNLSGPTPTILAKGYSIAGNNFLCKSSLNNCTSVVKPVDETISPLKNRYRPRWVVSSAIAIPCTFVISVAFFMCWVHWYKLRLSCTSFVQQDYEFDVGHLKRFSFRELQIATNNFSSEKILGRGGFGVVYKGFLPNKTAVAVKRLWDPKFTGEKQFQTEVEMIGLALHRNLLRLYGFCSTSKERLLVYPYMPNGSVADRLRDARRERACLDWKKRVNIAVGAARGLLYLHEQCNPRIIHRDVKAANILLDESFEAVVGDFGLAKLLDQRDSHVTTAVRGTVGHIAPEYLSTGQSSEKTDVFGFGILLLELVTGQKPFDSKGMILDSVKTLHEERREKVMVDGNLKGKYDSAELEKMVELALLCCEPQPELRPKMSGVLKALEAIVGDVAETMEQSGGAVEEEKGGRVSGRYSDGRDEASYIMEAMELSGPR